MKAIFTHKDTEEEKREKQWRAVYAGHKQSLIYVLRVAVTQRILGF